MRQFVNRNLLLFWNWKRSLEFNSPIRFRFKGSLNLVVRDDEVASCWTLFVRWKTSYEQGLVLVYQWIALTSFTKWSKEEKFKTNYEILTWFDVCYTKTAPFYTSTKGLFDVNFICSGNKLKYKLWSERH